MTINYKGFDKDFRYRLAEICFDDEKEQGLFDRLKKLMEIKGWSINEVTNGYASIEVENISEYREAVKDYKEIRKSIRLWERFGF